MKLIIKDVLLFKYNDNLSRRKIYNMNVIKIINLRRNLIFFIYFESKMIFEWFAINT